MKQSKLTTIALLASLALLISLPAFAGPHHGGHHGYGHHGHRSYGHHYGWVAPVIVGGGLAYAATRYYNPPQVYAPPINIGPHTVVPIAPVGYWCADLGRNGYFPEIQSCSNWQVVPGPAQ